METEAFYCDSYDDDDDDDDDVCSPWRGGPIGHR